MATPIAKILKKLDMTALALSDALDLSDTTVYKWTYSKARQGTGGNIPPKYHRPIMRLAKKKKVELTPSDFVAL
ncbi:MAG: hypothetical protein KAJ07_00565 [Planctomycetes bacterium]|nr:hypothetical protein [Planctomycetota bacterium]